MASVVKTYDDVGLFTEWPVQFVATHRTGGPLTKLRTAGRAVVQVVGAMLTGRAAALHLHVAQRTSVVRKMIFVLLALLWRIPYLFHLHGSEFRVYYESECGPLMRRVIQIALIRAHHVIALSESWAKWLRDVAPGARIVVAYNPVRIPSDLCKRPRAAGILRLLFLGRLGIRKGIYDLIEAMRTLRERGLETHLECGGDGEVEQVKETVRKVGLESSVNVLGWITGSNKTQLLEEADVYILPSYNEGLPIAILEAMAYGLPVITTPVGGIPEAIEDGVEGFLVPPGSIADLADRIGRLAHDRELRERMGWAARQRAQAQFDANVVVGAVTALYEEIGVQRI